jgi:hypothetical protein
VKRIYSFATQQEADAFRLGFTASLPRADLWSITVRRLWSRSRPYEVTLTIREEEK